MTLLDTIKAEADARPRGQAFVVPGTEVVHLTADEFDLLGMGNAESAAGRPWNNKLTSNSGNPGAPVTQWGAGIWDETASVVYIVAAGGHAAYGGTECYRLRLDQSIGWELLTLPAPTPTWDGSQNEDGTLILGDAQWDWATGPGWTNAAGITLSTRKSRLRSATMYGPGAIHYWGTVGMMGGLIYMRGLSVYPTNTLGQGAWIFDPSLAAIDAARAALLPELARLNPVNVIESPNERAPWNWLGQRASACINVLPAVSLVLYSNQGANGQLEDAGGNVIDPNKGVALGTGWYGTSWVCNHTGPAGAASLLVDSRPEGKKVYAIQDDGSPELLATLDNWPAHSGMAYNSSTDDCLWYVNNRIFRGAWADLITGALTTLQEVTDQYDWAAVNGNSRPEDGVRYLPEADVIVWLAAGTGSRFRMEAVRPFDHSAGGVVQPTEPEVPALDLQAIIDATPEGGVAEIPDGEWRAAAVVRKTMTIRGAGMDATSIGRKAIEGKAGLLLEANDCVIEDMEIASVRVSDGSGAGVRMDEGVNMTLRRVRVRDCQNGILGGGIVRGGGDPLSYSVVTLEDSVFSGNGHRGQAHQVYLGKASELRSIRTDFVEPRGGHQVKFGGLLCMIFGGRFDTTGSPDSVSQIDGYNGGNVIFQPDEWNDTDAKPRSIQIGAEKRDDHGLGLVVVPKASKVRHYYASDAGLIVERP